MKIPEQKVRSALKHLRFADPVLKKVIKQVGPFTLRLERDRFAMLVRSILSQQISTQAARTIRGRLEALLETGRPTPETIFRLGVDKLRTAGVSRQKAGYILDLAEKTLNQKIQLNRAGRMSDQDIIDMLTQVRGIGQWTAQMFLIFSLGRLDVFPHADLGVRSAISQLYGLQDLPDKTESCSIAEKWRPFASIASWYCWRSLDLKRQPKKTA